MGKQNDAIYLYLSDNRRFADLINGVCFHGEQIIKPENLSESSEKYIQELPDSDKPRTRERIRDIKKYLWRDERLCGVIAIEAESKIDRTMPWRCANYDILEYGKQLREIRLAACGRKLSGDPLQTFAEPARLIPCVTLCIYHGTKPWDGPKRLLDMIDDSRFPDVCRQMLFDYDLHLIRLNEPMDYTVFRTELRYLLAALPLRHDKKKLLQYFNENPSFQNMDRDTARTIAVLTNCNRILTQWEKYQTQEGGIDMCKAMYDLIHDSKEEGRIEGRIEGRMEGLEKGKQKGQKEEKEATVLRMLSLGLSEQLIHAVTELSIRRIRSLQKGSATTS